MQVNRNLIGSAWSTSCAEGGDLSLIQSRTYLGWVGFGPGGIHKDEREEGWVMSRRN